MSHHEASWKAVEKRYSRYRRERDFVPIGYSKPKDILCYLILTGRTSKEPAGKFLHNLDLKSVDASRNS